MKDSNAAPSSNNNAPATNAARGTGAAPKARAKAVSKAKSRAKAKHSKTKKPVAAATTIIAQPSVETSLLSAAKAEEAKPKAKVTAVEAPQVAAEAKVEAQSEIKAANAKQSETSAAKPAEAKVDNSQTATPEILFPEVLTPVVAQSKTLASAAATKVSAPKAANSVAKQAAAPTAATAVKSPGVAAKKGAVAANKSAVVAGSGVRAASAPAASPKRVASKRALPKFRPIYVFAALAAILLTTAGGVAVGSYNNWSSSEVIAPKVRIAGEPIGGMTRDQAIKYLNARFDKLAFTLEAGDKKVVMGLDDVGGKPSVEPTVDKAFAIGRSGNAIDNFTRVFGSEVKARSFSLPIEWNRGALTSRLQIVDAQYSQPAVDARLVTVSGATPRVTGEESGRALDVSATADAIQKSYYLGLGKIAAVTSVVEPKIVAAQLAGTDMKLGEYRTTYNGGIAGRTTNIHVACRAVDGTVLMPGEVLSFNELTGERTYKKGYRMAHIFLREAGQSESSIVDGLAGGVCQVSSTLYNAVRKTNAQATGKPLGIVERSSHSLPVSYVPSGRDATVAWPSKDFKFRNDNNFPVYVRTNVGNGRLTVSIWGRVPGNQAVPVSLEN